MHGEEIKAAVSRVVESGWYLQGEENARFEKNYADYIGSKHCIGVANGLDTLIWIWRDLYDETIILDNNYERTFI